MLPAALVGCLAPLAPDLAPLVLKLADPDYRVRDRADRSLEALGIRGAVPLLLAAENSPDAELRTRAATLLNRIGRRYDSQRAAAATLVQLRFENVPLATVLLELERQAGCQFWGRYDEAWVPNVKVSYATAGPEPFWDVVGGVCRQAGLEPNSFRPSVPMPPPVPGEARSPVPTPFVRLVSTEFEARAKAERDALEKAAADKNAVAKKNLEAFEAFAKAIEARAQRAVPVPQAPAPPAGVFPQPPAANNRTAASVVPDARAIYLTKRTGPAPVTVTAGAASVEFDSTVNSTTGPGGGFTAVLRVVPEPRLKLERIASVRVTRAVGAADELLTPNLSVPQYGAAVPSSSGRIRGLNAQIQIESSYDRVPQSPGLRVSVPFVGRSDFNGFSDIGGVIYGQARGPITEMLRLAELKQDEKVETAGPAFTRLVATLGEPDIDGTHPLTVTLTYSLNSGLVLAGAADIAAVADAAALPGPVPAATNIGYGQVYVGLMITDAAGVPFTLRPSALNMASVGRDGDRIYTRNMKLQASPTQLGQGPPARVGLYASTLRSVEIPFRLTGLK